MTILFAWLLADLLAGFIHFVEDRFLVGNSRFKFINQIAVDNDLHHDQPAGMLKFSPWENLQASVLLAWPATVFLLLVGAPTVIWLAVFFASFGNLIHRFAHTPRSKRPKFVRFMQWTGLFISFDQHNHHHFKANKRVKKEDTRGLYCPMTSWLNPILDRIGLWWLISKLFSCLPLRTR